jgi:hypothetical protein
MWLATSQVLVCVVCHFAGTGVCNIMRCCCFCCRVKLGPGGMDALITLGGGDMRRTLNILQVGTAAAHIQSMTRTRGICVLATVDMQLGSMLLHTA